MADEHLRMWFESVDTDRSGSINVSELQGALAAGNLRFPISVVHQMIRMYDIDQSGTMSFQEFVGLHKFLTLVRGLLSIPRVKVQSSFTSNARAGSLGLNETYAALKQAGFSLDQPSFYAACQSFDPSRSGKFRLDDYISLCIFLQSAKNLFGAFDVSKQGRVTLDFNQFVYSAANLRI